MRKLFIVLIAGAMTAVSCGEAQNSESAPDKDSTGTIDSRGTTGAAPTASGTGVEAAMRQVLEPLPEFSSPEIQELARGFNEHLVEMMLAIQAAREAADPQKAMAEAQARYEPQLKAWNEKVQAALAEMSEADRKLWDEHAEQVGKRAADLAAKRAAEQKAES